VPYALHLVPGSCYVDAELLKRLQSAWNGITQGRRLDAGVERRFDERQGFLDVRLHTNLL
jgi:hypothetical protein